jgi:release factor glutamine methyltransferase
MMDQEKEVQWLLQEKYAGRKNDEFYADCKRLALGEPLAYLIGYIPFMNCKIWLDGHPLIPRTETEYWVSEAIETINHQSTMSLGLEEETIHVLDLCAGSGCIGVSVLRNIPNSLVDFVEIDANLTATITKNIQTNVTEDKVEDGCVIHGNLFTTLKGTYHFILSNPPYIDENNNRTDQSVKDHEPYVALYGGQEGLETITSIIANAPNHLITGGQLWLEHEPEQSQAITDLGHAHGFSVSTHQDQYRVNRYSVLVLQ